MLRVAIVLGLLGVASCGASRGSSMRPHAEFTAEDARLFEDGVDLIENPDQLEGQWKLDWDRDLDRRVAQSDLIVIGTVNTLRDDVDLDQNTSYQIVLATERALVGEKPGSEMILISRQGATGYSSVQEHRGHLLGRKLIAFVRYAIGENDAAVAHFHLSSPSEAVTARIDTFEAQRRPSSVKIVEHKN